LVDETGTMERPGHASSALNEELEMASSSQFVEDLGEFALHFDAWLHLGIFGNMSKHETRRVATLNHAHGERRVVGTHGSCANQDGITLGTQLVNIASRFITGNPRGRTIGSSDTPIKGHGQLQNNKRPAGSSLMQIRLELFLNERSTNTFDHLYTGIAKPLNPSSGNLHIGIAHGHHDTRNSGFDDGVGTGWRATVMRTRFQRDYQR
jgi:hypothetical protein